MAVWVIVSVWVVLAVFASFVLSWAYPGGLSGGKKNGGTGDGYVPANAVIKYSADSVFDDDGNVNFSGYLSTGDIRETIWDFGDGAGSSDRTTAHAYTEPGRMTVQLTVVGSRGDRNTDTAYIHVNHRETHSGSLTAGRMVGYTVPVEFFCQGARLFLTYPTGQLLAGKPSNDIDLELYHPNGTKYADTNGQTADTGTTQTRMLDIPTQDMAASRYENWRVNVVCTTGINVYYGLEMTVRY